MVGNTPLGWCLCHQRDGTFGTIGALYEGAQGLHIHLQMGLRQAMELHYLGLHQAHCLQFGQRQLVLVEAQSCFLAPFFTGLRYPKCAFAHHGHLVVFACFFAWAVPVNYLAEEGCYGQALCEADEVPSDNYRGTSLCVTSLLLISGGEPAVFKLWQLTKINP